MQHQYHVHIVLVQAYRGTQEDIAVGKIQNYNTTQPLTTSELDIETLSIQNDSGLDW